LDDLPYYRGLCAYNPNYGTPIRHFRKAFKCYIDLFYDDIKATFKANPGIDEITEHIKSGGAVLLAYNWVNKDRRGGHFTLITEVRGKSYVCINDEGGKTVSLRRRKTIIDYLRPKTFCQNPREAWAWFLES